MSLPPSSPRLPSPPPPTEIQIGPKSPSLGDSSSAQDTAIEQGILDANSARRIHPGTRAFDMAAGPPLVPLMELDSAFQLQEHLKALHYLHTKPANATHTIPINRSTAAVIATPPNGVDRALWLYELCRFLINKCNDIIVGFLFDSPPCSSATCPEMRASEWQFLCAVHDTPKSCCAIDYCCHTLDWATNIVTSQKIFPSRLSLGAGDAMDERGAGVKHLVNIFRRLHRIFAHAWFQHREVFWRVEGQTGLYVLFKTVCDSYELLPAENYKLPPEAEGLEPAQELRPHHTILTSNSKPLANSEGIEEKVEEEDPSLMGPGRTNTRRHIRSSPSTGAAVTTVLEAEEDDSEITKKLVDMHMNGVDTGPGDKEVNASTEDAKSDNKGETKVVPKTEVEAEREAHYGASDNPEIEAQVEAEPNMQVPVESESHLRHPPESNEEKEVIPSPEQEVVAGTQVSIENTTSLTEKEAGPNPPESGVEHRDSEDK